MEDFPAFRLRSNGWTFKFGMFHRTLPIISADNHGNIGDAAKFLPSAGRCCDRFG